ncbi:MAG: PrsW family glutamic-type intramembrane protease [Ktedonobacteraceae bacterium]
MSQSYGVLRVVRVRSPASGAMHTHDKHPEGWLPEERLVHVLTRHETSIGRALSNEIVLMDPTVSREHARLVLDQSGWHIFNLTARNIVRVNGHAVASGKRFPLQSQDIVILGSTMLQFIAPQAGDLASEPESAPVTDLYSQPLTLPVSGPLSPQDGGAAEQRRQFQPLPGVPLWQQPASLWQQAATPQHEHIVLPAQPDPELMAEPWEDDQEESLLGAGITMRFALPQRMGIRTRWLIAGAGLAIVAISAMITLVLNSLIGITALAQNGASSILIAIIVPLIPALGVYLLVNFIDRFEREPWYLRLAAFLWGMLIAIPPALFVEKYIDGILQNQLGPGTSDVVRSILFGLNAGFTEETIKGLGILLLFIILRDEFDNVTDGIVYSAMIGAGFAMIENFQYFAGYKKFVVFLIVYRVVLGWLGHPTFTACFGVALGYTRHTRTRWKQIMIPLLGYLLAVVLHSFFDFIVFQAAAAIQTDPGSSSVQAFSLVAIIGDYIPPFLAQMVLLYFLIKSLAHEAAVIREFLAVEVSNGIVTVDEYALLQNSFQRTKQERRILFSLGVKQWLRAKALYQTEIGLAFRKWHVSMGAKRKQGYRRQPEDAYRQRIRRLRNEIRVVEAKAKAPIL